MGVNKMKQQKTFICNNCKNKFLKEKIAWVNAKKVCQRCFDLLKGNQGFKEDRKTKDRWLKLNGAIINREQ